MPLSAGQKIGAYEIVSPLGAGGMGEVYRARDSKLKREVAIKVLPADVANDRERLARFQREAEVLASLNHPHIAHVYGLEGNNPAEGGCSIIMELVEGEDLSQRIARGPIPLDEALPIAKQIAEALEAAHEAGIVHRDLKPGNIKVRDDGTVKVLDFGLAKAFETGAGNREPGAGSALANSPTITSPAMTMRGVILGTAAYMAPEQAKGKMVDRRADIWAFGCVLFEMLTGRRTFEGDDVSDTLVSVLRDDPRWAALPKDTPPIVVQLLKRCLQRDPQKRLPHIGTARLDLTDHDAPDATPVTQPRGRLIALSIVSGIIAVIAVAVAVIGRQNTAINSTIAAFAIEPPDDTRLAGGNQVPRFAISRDGQEIVYQVHDGTSARLWTRRLDAVDPTIVPGAESDADGNSAQQAFFSPDRRFIAYFDQSSQQLKRIDRQVGTSQVIANIPGPQYGGSWSTTGIILMSSIATDGIQQVSAGGGSAQQVTRIDQSRHEISHLWPQFFADGRHFVYLAAYGDGTPSAIFLGSLDGDPPRRLVESDGSAAPANGNNLIYQSEGATVAQRVDLDRGTLVGTAVTIGPPAVRTTSGRSATAASTTGVLVYSGGGEPQAQSVTRWVDRKGLPLKQAPPSVPTGFRGVRLSDDGTLLAYVPGTSEPPLVPLDATLEIWVQDLARAITTRAATATGGPGLTLAFSPDSTEVITRSLSNPVYRIARQKLFSATAASTVFEAAKNEVAFVLDFTPDGRRLVLNRGNNDSQGGIWLIPLDASGQPERYSNAPVRFGADVSPDGRWLAYTSGLEAGRTQVFLQSFPEPGGSQWPVSAVGGTHPRWSHDGRHLYFLMGNSVAMVTVQTNPRVQISEPQILFQMTVSSAPPGAAYPYDVAPDEQRFVYTHATGAARSPKLIVITDWARAAGLAK